MKVTTTQLNQTMISMRAVMRAVLEKANAQMGPLVISVEKTWQETNLTMQQARVALVELQSVVAPDSPLSVRLADALDDLTTASRQMGELSAYLYRNPSSLVRGRYYSDK